MACKPVDREASNPCAAALAAASKSTGDALLGGRIELPQPIKARAVDAPCVDPASFCTTYWSSLLPQGYTTARQR